MDVADSIELPKNVLRKKDDDYNNNNNNNNNENENKSSITTFVSAPPFCSLYSLCNPYPYPLSMTVKLIEGDSVLNFQKQTSLIKLRCMLNNMKIKKMEKVKINAKMFVEVILYYYN